MDKIDLRPNKSSFVALTNVLIFMVQAELKISLSPVGRVNSSELAILSPRGKVLENGMPRFFRRVAEGVFDLDGLKICTHELRRFCKRC